MGDAIVRNVVVLADADGDGGVEPASGEEEPSLEILSEKKALFWVQHRRPHAQESSVPWSSYVTGTGADGHGAWWCGAVCCDVGGTSLLRGPTVKGNVPAARSATRSTASTRCSRPAPRPAPAENAREVCVCVGGRGRGWVGEGSVVVQSVEDQKRHPIRQSQRGEL